MAILPNEVFLAIFVSLMQGMFCTERPAPRFWNHPDQRLDYDDPNLLVSFMCTLLHALQRVDSSAGKGLSTPLFLELCFIGHHDLIPMFASLLDVLSPTLGRCVYFSTFTINYHITDFLFGRLAGVGAASIQHLHLNVIPVNLSAQRGVGFAKGIFRAWNPAVHTLYETTLDALHLNNSGLHRNFDRSRSTFAAATINFGPKTVTKHHIDSLNLAWGWCTITALGDFNPDRGGHLVLWDLKLVIRFPPGSTILIPSAILHHSNVNIAKGEKHYSFTQFTAAGLFRWVDNGFKSDVTINQELAAQNNTATAAACLDARHTRWVNGVNSFKHWEGEM
ncbi:hypothetical protein K438DRAFT_2022378 [Mycena galopus ATCC 62051]|nr:hypothetical protein K438DRAFT_2022378 [Mycena galopus ATCC 62051]